MRRLLLSLLVCFTTLIQSYGQSAGGNILPYPILQTKMANGLNVVTVPYDSPGLVAFYIVVRVGSRDEIEPGKTGFAHFFEHMMFRGTEKYSKEQYSDALKATGASANANTWLDRTVYHMTGNAEMLEKMFELESDRFMNLKYSVQDFKTEAGAVKGEYTKNSASPYVQLNEKMQDVAFSKHTYKHTTMGFFEDVVNMPNQFDFSLEFFKRFYRPEYTTLIVVGDVNAEKVNGLAQKYFGSWKRGTYVNTIPPEPEQTATKYAHVKMEGFPPALSMNYKSPAFGKGNKEVVALDLLLTILFSEKSALYKKLVVNEQKVRSLEANVMFTRDPYLAQIDASVKEPADLQYVRNEITKTLKNAATSPMDGKDIKETKMRMRYGFAMGLDSPTKIAENLSYFTWVTGEPESINTVFKMVDQITPEDMMAAAKKYLTDTRLTLATISPDEKCPVK